jgi:hypothetical protein
MRGAATEADNDLANSFQLFGRLSGSKTRRWYFVVSNGADRYDFRRMISALLLIFNSVPTWERIAVAQRKWVAVLMGHLLPLLLLASLVEGYGLAHWGKPRGRAAHLRLFALDQVLVFELAQLIVSLGIVFFGARLVKSLGETFHGRHSFTQTFTATAYGLSPLFLVRMLDALPWLSPWATWGVGIMLSAAILYNGLPRIMQPDPPHALGLYLMSVLLLIMITGVVCFLKAWYLQGKFTKLDALIPYLTML